MIEARRTSLWTSRYDIVADGERVATWSGSAWRSGGTAELAERRYEVRGNLWGSTFGMVNESGTRMASAERVGRKSWTIEAGGVTYRFRRVSPWRHEEEMHVGGVRVGSVKRTSIWRGDAVADLPGLPLDVAVFVLSVVLTKWDSDAAAAG